MSHWHPARVMYYTVLDSKETEKIEKKKRRRRRRRRREKTRKQLQIF
jgi:hypothetical protein